jgi:hypothetical protein
MFPKELALASDERKPILPVFIEDVDLPSEIRYQIAGIQHISLSENPSRAYTKINAALMRLLKKRPQSRQLSSEQGPASKLANIHPTWLAGGATALIAVTAWLLWSLFNTPESAKQRISQRVMPSTKPPIPMPITIPGAARLRIVLGHKASPFIYSSPRTAGGFTVFSYFYLHP